MILALNLYLKLPFGKMDRRNPDVIHLANIIGRTPNAVALRLVNYASSAQRRSSSAGLLPKGRKNPTPCALNMLLMQKLWNSFRNKLMTAVFQRNGLNAIPAPSWGDLLKSSFAEALLLFKFSNKTIYCRFQRSDFIRNNPKYLSRINIKIMM